jgi:hypothetical protein
MPAVVYAFLSTLRAQFRSQLSLRVENVALRHQLAVYQRTDKPPSIRLEAGARFGVSSGLTPASIEAALACRLPLLPGVMTPSDVLVARAAGFTALKLFPAQRAAWAC